MSARTRLLQASTIVLAIAVAMGSPFAATAASAESDAEIPPVSASATGRPTTTLEEAEGDAGRLGSSETPDASESQSLGGTANAEVGSESDADEPVAGASDPIDASSADRDPEAVASDSEPGVGPVEESMTFASLVWEFEGVSGDFGWSATSDGKVAGSGNPSRLVWNEGAGSVTESTGAFDLAFVETQGVRLGQPELGSEVDIERLRVASGDGATAKLIVDLSSRAASQVKAHDVELAEFAVSRSGGAETRRWTTEMVTLSDEGAAALGSSWSPGESLGRFTVADAPVPVADPASPVVPDETPAASPEQTTLALMVDRRSVVEGSSISLTATLDPAEALGDVQFAVDGKPHGDPLRIDRGIAKLSTKLPVGTHSVEASFTATDGEKFTNAQAQTVQITVTPKIVDLDITSAQLTWGVKASFRNYIYNYGSFKGRSTLLGATTQPTAKGEFVWNGGTGSVKSDASAAKVALGAANGVHFQSHPMPGGYALDLRFTNPQIEVSENGAGKLYLDVKSRKFDGMDTVSTQFFTQKKVHVADIQFPAATVSGKTTTWKNAPVTLTKVGAADAFGGFYQPGDAVDPVTVSVNTESAVTGVEPTAISLTASDGKVSEGSEVTLTTRITPRNVAGDVRFSSGGAQIGTATPVRGGAASAPVQLPVGIHAVTATFTPKSKKYGRSVSSPLQVTVVSSPKTATTPGAPAPTDGAAAGSLSWSVSNAFAAYTTCTNKEAYGYAHCAKGSIETNGVGAGYLFPQAASSSWDRASQTGTVSYSGSVAFTGYGMTMYNVSNPSITVSGPASATLSTGNSTSFGSGTYQLDLASGSKSVGAGGEVTWSNVPVLGTLSSGGAGGSGSQSIGLDPLTFTVGAESRVSFGATAAGSEKKQYTAADTPPATTGVTVLTDAEKLTPGGRIEIEASGFDPDDEGVLVVLYSDPIVLDDAATADKNGVVRWSGTLPKDVRGTHTITIQGSTNAGAVIDIVEPKKKKSARSADVETEALSGAVAEDRVTSAAIIPAGGMALWEWWASAAGLAAIAACMTLLTIRQRRNSA